MKLHVVATALILTGASAPALAQTGSPATAPTPAATAAAVKFDLDTPIEDIVANPAAKAVLDRNFPGMATSSSYDMFKSMSLSSLSQMSDKITPDKLAKVKAELALVK